MAFATAQAQTCPSFLLDDFDPFCPVAPIILLVNFPGKGNCRMSSRERKRLLIHQAIQGNLLFRFALHWILFSAATCIFMVTLQTHFNASLPAELRSEQTRLTVLSFALVSLALLPAFSIDLLKLSHRFVGPVVRLQKYIRQVQLADSPRFKLRESDYWQDLAVDVNAMFARLRCESHESTQGNSGDDAHCQQPELLAVGGDDRSAVGNA